MKLSVKAFTPQKYYNVVDVNTMRWGVVAWSYSDAPVEAVLELLRKEGVQHVELGGMLRRYVLGVPPPSMNTMTEAFGYKPPTHEEVKKRAEKLRETLAAYRIEPLQMHAPGYNLSEFDEPAVTVKEVVEAIELSSWLGVNAVVVHPIVPPSMQSMGDLDWQSYQTYASKLRETNIKSFEELASKAEDLSLILAVENMFSVTRCYGSNPADLLDLVNEIHSDSLGICLDTGHANLNGLPPHKFLEKVKDRLVATHIHDNNGREDQHLPPLMGNIDWQAFFRALRESGYPKPIIYEISGGQSLKEGENRLRLLRYISEKTPEF